MSAKSETEFKDTKWSSKLWYSVFLCIRCISYTNQYVLQNYAFLLPTEVLSTIQRAC